MRPTPGNTGRRDRRGIALLMVLSVLAVLSILAVSFVKLSSMEQSIARNYLDRTRALMAAESGIEYAISRLSKLGADEAAELEYVPGAQPGLEHADRASFQNPDFSYALSGVVAGSYATDGDYYALRVQDETGRLNLNDTDGIWNLDDDATEDEEDFDPDLVNAPHRLAEIVRELGSVLFDPVVGSDISIQLFTLRQSLPGARFSNLEQVRGALDDLGYLTGEQIDAFMDNVTLDTWQDPQVLRPTFQLDITNPDFLGDGTTPYDDATYSTEFNVYLYSDFQTRYFETEPRSPVCVNSASRELLQALIAPVRGWYLYEGTPCALMDSGYKGPWTRAMRCTSYTRLDYEQGRGLAQEVYGSWHPGIPSAGHPSLDSQLYNQTRYGLARQTKPLSAPATGVDLDGNGVDDSIASVVANELYNRIHDLNQPFGTWDEFSRFLYELVDLNAEILADEFSSPLEEGKRFPMRIGTGTQGSFYAGKEGDRKIPGFDRYMADALLANFSPNPLLNDHNPDFHLFRHVDKTQLTSYSTELSLQSTGRYAIESFGGIRRENGAKAAGAIINARVQMFHMFRVTTQEQFMRGYRQDDHDSLYELFAETGDLNNLSSGADLQHQSGALVGKNGPSLMSYPEPIRNFRSFAIDAHPDPDQQGVYFSHYDGSLMLNTQQRARDMYPIDTVTAQPPMFMAPMGWRNLDGVLTEDIQWPRRTCGVGGMMPLVWGNNHEVNYDMLVNTGATVEIASDERDRINVSDGRGAMLLWNDYYGNLELYDTGAAKLGPPAANYPQVNTTPPHLPFWAMHGGAMSYASPWFDPATGNAYANWEFTEHWYADHSIHVPVMFSTQLDGNSTGRLVDRNIARLAWNYPTDCPVTPHHRDNAGGGRVDRVQGNLYPDGAFSEAGRLLSYPATNLGSNGGFRGAVCFWAKPHWDAGYSNRMRLFFSTGHVGNTYLDAMGIYYFPASPHPTKRDFPTGGTREAVPGNMNMGGVPWPAPRNSFFAGTASMFWTTGIGYDMYYEGYGNHTPTATDFMPYRDMSRRSSHTSLGFYGHQWNLMAFSYDHNISGGGAPGTIQFFLNGNTFASTAPYSLWWGWDPDWPEYPDLPGEFDPYWEESHYHCWEAISDNELKGEPENLHQGEGYLRFGFNDETAGPVADSTFDEIVTWAGPVAPIDLEDLWSNGRYINQLLDVTGNTSTIGLYTSPEFDLGHELKAAANSTGGALQLHSVNWTLWWPRYNWRPSDNSTNPDWTAWTSGPIDGIQGVDLQSAGAGTPDPVTGQWDPITVDVYDPAASAWLFSRDGAGGALCDNVDVMPHTASGSYFTPQKQLRLNENEKFRFRVYFHLNPGQTLLESPVLDDITFTFLASKPAILSWEIKIQ